MSCFIVPDYHINALVSYGIDQGAGYHSAIGEVPEWVDFSVYTAQALASRLYRANVCSVNRRYGERTRTTGFKFKRVDVSHLTPADIVKACDCFDYQSCETKTWERSDARKALQAIREKAIHEMTKESYTWALDEPEAA